jgi:hypothetical protein
MLGSSRRRLGCSLANTIRDTGNIPSVDQGEDVLTAIPVVPGLIEFSMYASSASAPRICEG